VFRYDPLAETLTTSVTATAVGVALLATTYTYDPVGNVTRRVTDCAGPDGGPGPGRTQSDFTVDAVYRVVSATGREAVGDPPVSAAYAEAYRYDRSSNLVAIDHQAEPPAPSWAREVVVSGSSNHAVPRSMIDGNTPDDFFRYGDMIAFDATAVMTYDYRHALTSTETSAGTGTDGRARMLVAADRERTRRLLEPAVPGASTDTLYLGDGDYLYVEERTSGDGPPGVVRSLQVTDDDGLPLLVRLQGNGWDQDRYPLQDDLDSVLVELDAQARVLTVEEYSPWGETTVAEAASETERRRKRYRFSGQERDQPTGLYYFGARYYAPGIGRWTQPDPLATIDGLDLYMYVGDDPESWLDPFGFARTKRKKKKFKVSHKAHVNGGFSLKIEGRPGKFVRGTLTALYTRDPSQHVSKTRLRAGLNRNHIFPFHGISKSIRTATRGFNIPQYDAFLQRHHFKNKNFEKQMQKLTTAGITTMSDVEKGATLVIKDEYNNPKNIYIGNAVANSSMGSQMKHYATKLKNTYGTKKLSVNERLQLQQDFENAAIDAPNATSSQLRRLVTRHRQAWGRRLGKYVT
jgi:RHS repeat-associated protein